MANANGTGIKLGYEDGFALGIQLLHQLEELEGAGEFEPHSLDPDERKPGTAQANVVLDYLDRARTGGRAVECGFTAVLTDFLSGARQGTIRDSSSYEQWLGA